MAVNDIVMGAAGASAPATYVEDVFSTWLYTGNGSTQTITNGIDLSGKGGLVWAKSRNAAEWHSLCDTARGVNSQLFSNATNAANASGVTQFNSNGYATTGSQSNLGSTTYASWTFRKQPKFFDVVTWTGNGNNRTIAHNLGSVPGCVIVKNITTSGYNWAVWHRSLTTGRNLYLNTTAAEDNQGSSFFNGAPTSTVLNIGFDNTVNASGNNYVAYVFAHDAGGFGATGTDNVISCGSFTTDASGNATVNLGYEPQWLMVKNATTASNNEWRMVDNMRGFPVDGASSSVLTANTSDAEFTSGTINVLNTGFQIDGLANSATFIYIAIRRPMKTPTTGTEVFDIDLTRYNPASLPSWRSNFPVDMAFIKDRTSAGNWGWGDRLRGIGRLYSNTTDAETTNSFYTWDYMNGWGSIISADSQNPSWMFRRAPGFFDEVCYTGTGVARTVNHNLGVVPELMIVKSRNLASRDWMVYCAGLTANNFINLNLANAQSSSNYAYIFGNGTVGVAPTSSVFTVGSGSDVNSSIGTYVAYLFATVAGVSKVGSYTGTGATLNINAGFTTGARFVMIKRTDASGSWFVWDTARGMVSGTDPRLALNSTAAESNANWVYTASSGFQIVTTDATVNASGGTYIYLAIA